MIINEEGTYNLVYTATDECGNETVVNRELIVERPPATYRTVLYTDGTFIINESSYDEADNIALHGAATNVYAPFDPNGATDVEKYIFTSEANRPWHSQRAAILKVEIGSSIQPTSMGTWFSDANNCISVDFSNLDASNVETMFNLFYGCSMLQSIDFNAIDTSNVNSMANMFYNCFALTNIDLSSFNTNSVLDMETMFYRCTSLKTIYASADFIVTQVTSSRNMFAGDTQLIGGAGTTYNAYAAGGMDKTRAKIDGGTYDPGYFTAKP